MSRELSTDVLIIGGGGAAGRAAIAAADGVCAGTILAGKRNAALTGSDNAIL